MRRSAKWMAAAGVAAVLVAALGAIPGWPAAAAADGVELDPGQALRIELLEAALAPASAEECAVRWAESIATRNGALQYAVSAPALRRELGEGAWVMGVSSPSVDSYEVRYDPAEVTATSGRFRVVLYWWTSTGGAGATVEEIEVQYFAGAHGGAWLVTGVAGSRYGGGLGSMVDEPVEQDAPAQEPAAGVATARVPFLAVERPTKWRGVGRYPVRSASWDLERGVLSLGDIFFQFSDASGRGLAGMAWDGGKRVVLTPEPADEVDLVADAPGGAAADVGVVKVNSTLDLVCAPSDRKETAVVRHSWPGEPVLLEIWSGGEPRRLALAPELPTGASLVRPVGAEWVGDALKIYFETSVAGESGLSCGLVEAVYSGGLGERITWREVASGLEISEAGAGTRMVKAGDAIYIGRQEGTVLKVDIATGAVGACDEIDQALSQFRDTYAHRVEYCAPPDLYVSGDVMIVDYEPPARRPEMLDGRLIERIVPVKCMLAVRDGRVVGRVVVADGRALVMSGDRVTQVIVFPSVELPVWVFPVDLGVRGMSARRPEGRLSTAS